MKLAPLRQSALAAVSFVSVLQAPLVSTSVTAVATLATVSSLCAPTALADNRSEFRALDAKLASATRQERSEMLSDSDVRYWGDLTRTGRREVLDALDDLYNDLVPTPANASHGLLPVERALRFAAVNDALYDGADAADLVELLSPELSRHLGTNRGAGSEEETVAEALLAAVRQDDIIFTSLESFEKAYWRAVVLNWSGK